MSYVIGSGYIGADKAHQDFFEIWWNNLGRNPDVNPSKTFVVCSKDQHPYYVPSWIQKLQLSGNLGHICRDSSQRHQIEGWPVDMMIGALLAYDDESDFLFIEQDCLPFGPFVTKLQEECGNEGMIFGSNSWMPSAQALFYVRHSFIPVLVREYLDHKLRDRKAGGESIFAEIEKKYKECKRMSFGFDRDRPPGGFESMKPSDVWYVQQIQIAEIAKLRECGHINK